MDVSISGAGRAVRGDALIDGTPFRLGGKSHLIQPVMQQWSALDAPSAAMHIDMVGYGVTLSQLRTLRRDGGASIGLDPIVVSDRSFELAEDFLGLLSMHGTSFHTSVTICDGMTLYDPSVAVLTIASGIFTARIAFTDDGALVARVDEGRGEHDLPIDDFDGDDIPYQLANIFDRPTDFCMFRADQTALIAPACPDKGVVTALAGRDDVLRGLDALHAIASPMNGLYDGLSGEVIATAARFMASLPATLPRPQLSASDDGEMGLSWFANGKRFEVMISPDALAWISGVGGDYQPGKQFDIDDEKALPSLLTALSGFYDDRSADDRLGCDPVPA